MVSAAMFGLILEQGYQSGVALNVDLGTNNGQCVSSALHGGLSSEESVQKKATREAIKRKLTARVLPMTRSAESNGKKTAAQIQNEVPIAQRTSATCNISNVQPCTDGNVFPTPRNDQQRPIKKPNARTSKLITVSGSNAGFSEIEQDQPPTKRPRPILPRTVHQSQIGPESIQRQPRSPEPKLMGDNLATMSLLSASECHLATLQDEDGDTPLHIAIAHENMQLTEYLVDLVACLTVDTYNNLKQTPLHLAVITQQPLVVKKLVTSGANVNLPDRNGHAPAHLACQRSSTECLEQLFHTEKNIDLELKNFNGFMPLHEAVFASNIGTIQCLINHGANVNCKDGKSGRSPLHHAVEAENVAVIEQLLRCGADPSAAAFSGNTALQTASGRGMQYIRLVLETAMSSCTKGAMGKSRETSVLNPMQSQPLHKIKRKAITVKDTYI